MSLTGVELTIRYKADFVAIRALVFREFSGESPRLR